MSKTTLEILIDARNKISSSANWGKGRRGHDRSHSTCCMAEAVEDATDIFSEGKLRIEAFAALRNAAGIADDWGAIVHWNDALERTHAEVLAAFDKAIEAERTKASP